MDGTVTTSDTRMCGDSLKKLLIGAEPDPGSFDRPPGRTITPEQPCPGP